MSLVITVCCSQLAQEKKNLKKANKKKKGKENRANDRVLAVHCNQQAQQPRSMEEMEHCGHRPYSALFWDLTWRRVPTIVGPFFPSFSLLVFCLRWPAAFKSPHITNAARMEGCLPDIVRIPIHSSFFKSLIFFIARAPMPRASPRSFPCNANSWLPAPPSLKYSGLHAVKRDARHLKPASSQQHCAWGRSSSYSAGTGTMWPNAWCSRRKRRPTETTIKPKRARRIAGRETSA